MSNVSLVVSYVNTIATCQKDIHLQNWKQTACLLVHIFPFSAKLYDSEDYSEQICYCLSFHTIFICVDSHILH